MPLLSPPNDRSRASRGMDRRISSSISLSAIPTARAGGALRRRRVMKKGGGGESAHSIRAAAELGGWMESCCSDDGFPDPRNAATMLLLMLLLLLQPFIVCVCVFVWLPVAAHARQTQHTTRDSRCGGRLVFKVPSQYNTGSASFCWPATKSIRRQQTHRSW